MKSPIQRKLRVYPAWREDVFRDITRISEQDRGGIREGSICTIFANGHGKRLIVRGLDETLGCGIMLDEITRRALGNLEPGISYDFTIQEALGAVLGAAGLWIAYFGQH